MSKNLKSVLRLIGLTLVAAIFGGFVGYYSGAKQQSLSEFLNMLGSYGHIFVLVLTGITIVSFLLSIYLYVSGKKYVSMVDGENEEFCDKADSRLCNSLILMQINTIIGMISIGIMPTLLTEKTNFWIPLFIVLGSFIVIQILSPILLVKIVKQIQILSPEKKGYALDKNFQKDWMKSCDEAEKKRIGEAGFYSYMITSKAFPIVILACMLLSVILEIGAVPVIAVGCVWLISSGSYSYKSVQLERKSRM